MKGSRRRLGPLPRTPSKPLDAGSHDASSFPPSSQVPIVKRSLFHEKDRGENQDDGCPEGRQDRLEQACRTHRQSPSLQSCKDASIARKQERCPENRRIVQSTLTKRMSLLSYQTSRNNEAMAAKTGQMARMPLASLKARLRNEARLRNACQSLVAKQVAITKRSRRKQHRWPECR